ncbi:TMEM175 family protein [Sphingomonas oryzagri]
MDPDRLKALTDGVIAVIITIMVLEMKPPESTSLDALLRLAPVFLSYVLNFVYVVIYWNNHHHFFALTPRVTGGIMWGNLHLRSGCR